MEKPSLVCRIGYHGSSGRIRSNINKAKEILTLGIRNKLGLPEKVTLMGKFESNVMGEAMELCGGLGGERRCGLSGGG